MKKWILAAVLAAAAGVWSVQAAWGVDGGRMVFDRGGGFTAGAGEEVRIGARVEGGGGFGITRWEGNVPGRAEGRRNESFVVDKPEGASEVRCVYSQAGTSFYNKEHIWAQSHGIDTAVPGYSDVHHIRACIHSLNDMRADKDFDNCRGVSGAESSSGCHSTSDAFEPPDAAKGDVARACFYMAVRYQGKYNANANLELVDFVGTTSDGNQLGKLSTLLSWNELDPPDDFERRRNELIYTSYQHNRNPFIDHPAWVRAVFDPAHFEGERVVWTVSVMTSGEGVVDDQRGPFPAGVTNGTDARLRIAGIEVGGGEVRLSFDRVASGIRGTDKLTGEWKPLPEADYRLDGTNATIPLEKAYRFLRAE